MCMFRLRVFEGCGSCSFKERTRPRFQNVDTNDGKCPQYNILPPIFENILVSCLIELHAIKHLTVQLSELMHPA